MLIEGIGAVAPATVPILFFNKHQVHSTCNA